MNLPAWEDDYSFGIWLNEMLDWEDEQYEEEHLKVPDLASLRMLWIDNLEGAIADAEDLKYGRVICLLEKGIAPPYLQKWIAAQLRTGGFKSRIPASKKVAHAAWVLRRMKGACLKYYHRSYRKKPLKSLIAFAAERCKIDERSLHKYLKGR